MEVSDRFPMLGFSIRTDRPDIDAEVALATDIGLFAPENRHQRTAANFYSSREGGRLTVPRGEGVFVVPSDVLARFIGGDRLFFGLATGHANNGGMNVDAMPREGSPYISLRELTGRTLRRANFGGRGRGFQRAPVFEWAGDQAKPGSEPARAANGAGGGNGGGGYTNGSAARDPVAPQPYDDGFGAMPAPAAQAQAYQRQAPRAEALERVVQAYAPTTGDQAAAAQVDFARRLRSWEAGVPDTSVYPHSAICAVLRDNGAGGWVHHGTATYVAPDLLLTAAHVLANKVRLRILVGRNGSNALKDFIVQASDWTKHPLYDPTPTLDDLGQQRARIEYDLGVIRVPDGQHNPGFMALEDLVSHGPNTPIIVCGYSQGSGVDSTRQHLDGDYVREALFDEIRYNLQTLGGSSGSAVYAITGYEDHERQVSAIDLRVIGVHDASNQDGVLNRACRLTQAKIDWIRGRGLVSAQGLAQPMTARGSGPDAPLVTRGAVSARAGAIQAPGGGGARMLSADPLTVDVKYRMFIPSPAIDAPIGAYGGDGRGFSYDQGTSRGEIHAKVKLTPGGGIESISIVDRHWGESTAYSGDQVFHPEGKPDWWLEKIGHPEPTERATLAANDANLSIQAGAPGTVRAIMTVSEGSSLFSITASGGMPLSLVAPNIDADIGVFLRLAGGGVEAKVMGEHDSFPAHELYLNGHRVYGYDPVANNEGPTSLLPPMDRSAETGWTSITAHASAQAFGARAMDGGEPAIVRPPLPSDPRARARRIGGQFSDQIGRALDLGLEEKMLVPLFDVLDRPAGAQPMGARAMDGGLGAAVAIAGIVVSTLTSSAGDVTWDLDQGRGIKHPGDVAPANPAPMRDGDTITITGPASENYLGDMIRADFEVRWQCNGKSLGNVVIGNLRTNDAVGWGLAVRAQLMDDNIVYAPDGCAALRIRFHWRFTRTIGSDLIAVSDLKLLGDGRTEFSTRWTQQ
jgi:V8-like Glu-specific endopeptidase